MKIMTHLPEGLRDDIDYIAQVEHRNRSDLIREALRRYVAEFKRDPANYKFFEHKDDTKCDTV